MAQIQFTLRILEEWNCREEPLVKLERTAPGISEVERLLPEWDALVALPRDNARQKI
jgi:hypothetical protein